MKLPQFYFEKPEGESRVHIAGHTATWNLCTVFENDVEIKGIDVQLQGRERTFWMAGHGKKRSSCRGHHVILTAQKRVQGPTTVLRGAHQWTVTFGIPSWAQSSLNQGTGNYVKYVLKARVRIASLLSKDPRHAQEIEVRQPVFNPQLHALARARPVSLSAEMTRGGCWILPRYRRSPISLSIRLDKGVYIPGESIKCHVRVEQAGMGRTQALARVSVDLLRRCTTCTHASRDKGFRQVTEVYRSPPCLAMPCSTCHDRLQDTIRMDIDPSLPPSRLDNLDCRLWQEGYVVRVQVYMCVGNTKSESKEKKVMTREIPIILVNTWERNVVAIHDVDPLTLSWMDDVTAERVREGEREGEREGARSRWYLAAFGSRGKVTHLPVMSIEVGDDTAFTPLMTAAPTTTSTTATTTATTTSTSTTTTSTLRYCSRDQSSCLRRAGMMSREWSYLPATPLEWRDVQ